MDELTKKLTADTAKQADQIKKLENDVETARGETLKKEQDTAKVRQDAQGC